MNSKEEISYRLTKSEALSPFSNQDHLMFRLDLVKMEPSIIQPKPGFAFFFLSTLVDVDICIE